MRKDKKPLWRWIGEATLIFLTILAAFYVDNYRDHKAQESLYLKHLQDFKNDLASGIQKMSFELNSEGDKLNQSGYLVSGLASYDSLVNMISNGNRSSANVTMDLLAVYANQRFTKWIFKSPHYDKLTVDYYYFIKNADLKDVINSHKNDHLHRHEAKDFFNKTMDDLQILTDNLNFDKPGDRSNLSLLYSNPMVNKVDRLAQSYLQLKGITELNRTRDSLILVEVNKELADWGIVQ